MNILIGGVCRSGTTRLFNCVRLIALQNYSEQDIQATQHTRIIKNSNHKINISKTHINTEEWNSWADLIFSTNRNMMYVAASCLDQMDYLNRNLEIFTKHFENGFILHYKSWINKSDLVIEYELWEEKKEEYINQISKFLNLECNTNEIIKTLNEYKIKADPSTLMIKNHISPNSNKHIEDRLSKEEFLHFKNLFQKHSIQI